MIDEDLAQRILDDFNNAVDVDDTIFYNEFVTLYDKILETIDGYMNNKHICTKCGLYLYQTDGMTAGEFDEYRCRCD